MGGGGNGDVAGYGGHGQGHKLRTRGKTRTVTALSLVEFNERRGYEAWPATGSNYVIYQSPAFCDVMSDLTKLPECTKQLQRMASRIRVRVALIIRILIPTPTRSSNDTLARRHVHPIHLPEARAAGASLPRSAADIQIDEELMSSSGAFSLDQVGQHRFDQTAQPRGVGI